MPLDVKTLVFCHFLLNAFLVALLVYYRARQRTFPGFGEWTAGWVLLALGYLVLAVRDRFMASLAGVLAANALFSLGVLLEWEASYRFARNRSMPRWLYLLPLPLLVFVGWFTVVHESVAVRSLGIGVLVATTCWGIAWNFLRDQGWRNPLFFLFVVINLVYGLLTFIRAVVWVVAPQHGLFEAWIFQQNAVEFTCVGSEVRASLTREEGRPVVRVSDRGEGIAPGLADTLFDPFVTGRPGHMGLGLSLARHYLAAHGAELSAGAGSDGVGTTVTVTFPADSQGPPSGKEKGAPRGDLQGDGSG